MSSRPGGLVDLETAAPSPFTGAIQHLEAELDWLLRLLHAEILRLKAANLLAADPFRGLYLSDEQVDAILRSWNTEQRRPPVARIADLRRQAAATRHEIDSRVETHLPLLRLAAMFDLSEFERHVLIAALAVDMDLRFEALYSWARNDVTRKSLSVDLALKLFCEDGSREAFREDAPLFRNQLLCAAGEPQERETSFLGRSLRVDSRIAQFLLAEDVLDARLSPFTTLITPSHEYNSLHLPDALRSELQSERHPIMFLCGPWGAGKRSAAEALCLNAGCDLLVADLSRIAGARLAPHEAFALLQREAVLRESALLLEHAEALMTDAGALDPFGAALERLHPRSGVRVFIASEAPWPRRTGWPSFDFSVPVFSNRLKLWREALDSHEIPASAADVERLANRFALTGGAIHCACADAARRATLSLGDLEKAARAQSNHGLRRFSQKVENLGTWDSLVLPPHIMRQLRDVCIAERHRHTVYSKWGFDRHPGAGKGLNVLFCGTSGTGKTMAAGVLARELGLDLYRIDLSIVVSKYIGETEKQLNLIFREAKSSNAVLFFDEADALFGKRSEVKDAHDRYANVEIAYLLQKMEDYEGIVILATNLRRNIDDAFTRRMGHVIEFPFPDAEHRERIWKSVLPPDAPVSACVNFGFLARQFELAGGNIRNIALAAAFMAAEEGSTIRMEHCIIATALELQKTGKLPSRAEFRDYYEMIRLRV